MNRFQSSEIYTVYGENQIINQKKMNDAFVGKCIATIYQVFVLSHTHYQSIISSMCVTIRTDTYFMALSQD